MDLCSVFVLVWFSPYSISSYTLPTLLLLSDWALGASTLPRQTAKEHLEVTDLIPHMRHKTQERRPSYGASKGANIVSEAVQVWFPQPGNFHMLKVQPKNGREKKKTTRETMLECMGYDDLCDYLMNTFFTFILLFLGNRHEQTWPFRALDFHLSYPFRNSDSPRLIPIFLTYRVAIKPTRGNMRLFFENLLIIQMQVIICES